MASLLKPLSGLERDLESNLEAFFRQDYPEYEILFAVNHGDDPAIEMVERLRRKHPERAVRLAMAVNSPYPNAKVYSMERMTGMARGEVLVISDSDVGVGPGYLREVMRPFTEVSSNPRVGVVTCLYRGAPGNSLWSRLEALAMTTQFMPGVLVAWAIEGMRFALGPTMAVRRDCLEAMGGFRAMSQHLADDFLLGKWAVERGYRVVLSSYVLDHLFLGESFESTFQHRLRWARSTRRSRPMGYLGEGFTHSTAAALLLVASGWGWAPAAALMAATLLARGWVSWEVGWRVLRDPHFRSSWWLVPFQDLLGFTVWLGGFAGGRILWRGVAYRVDRDGRFEPVPR